jgi:hypothetical protein
MSKIEVNTIEPQCGTTLTLGASGDTVTLASGASQSGFGRTGTVDWQTTPKTGDFTAANGEGYFVNTTSGAITMTMPSGSAGAIVSIQDYNKTFDSNAFTVAPASGEKINGGNASQNLVISTEGQGLTFVYVDGTVGWKTVHENEFTAGGSSFIQATGGTVTCSGNCRIHTFTGPGTFSVTRLALCSANNQVSYMVVAGGGSGGSANNNNNGAAGGGAGGFREDKSPTTPYTSSPLEGAGPITVTATNFPITVGGGGTAVSPINPGNAGSPSTFSTITSAGGGFGANNNACGGAGGSGGGAGNVGKSGGAGNTPPVSPAQGFPGGNGSGCAGPSYGAGGGGGATVAGTNGASPASGPGGAGATTHITGSPVAYAGGGGGGAYNVGTVGTGGTGGGGAGNNGNPANPGTNGTAGTANTGGGGGGNNQPAGTSGAGGSGVVIIRYKIA